ncbi:MAG: hypothetical protein LBM64_00865 [Deltaproteobacteria bacterium]|jgi:hypothetical protein|nr:hypothetical protein [Deltaproteobacteria bacterium]
MDILLLKFTLTPLLIAAATLAARRWGPVVAGWLAGLPLTSGPISVFLAVEQGGVFASHAAVGSILGVVGAVAFCVTYALSARRFGWRGSILCSFLVYSPTVLTLSHFGFSLPAAVLTAVLVLLAGMLVARSGQGKIMAALPPWWDLPMRMLVAALLLLALTAAAHILGPQMSGILAPFPIMTCVMAIFSHAQYGEPGVRLFIHGILTAMFSLIAFYVVVSLLVENSTLIAYLAASGAAILVNLAAWEVLRLLNKQRAQKRAP